MIFRDWNLKKNMDSFSSDVKRKFLSLLIVELPKIIWYIDISLPKSNWTHVYTNFFVDFDPRIMSAAFGSLKLGHPVCYDLDSLLLAVILRKHVRI